MSDRRTFLGNATAAAVMAKMSSLSLLGFAAEGPEMIDPTMSDREKAGLRGPVKTSVDETNYVLRDDKYSTATEYSPDGRLLTSRNINSDGSGRFRMQTYEADGRLAKTISGKIGEPGNESLYSYDETGRLLGITNHPEKGGRIDFQYDEQGRKTSVQRFDSETFKRIENAGYAGSAWDGAVAGFGVPVGGNVMTIYNDSNQPTEAQLRDSQGRMVSRIVRSYDAHSRIIEEEEIRENPMLLFLAMAAAKGQPQPTTENAEELEAVNKILKAELSVRRSYTYDAQGRVIEMRHRRSRIDIVATTSYNEHGDKSAEVETRTRAGEVPPDWERIFGESQVRYVYQYDGHNNWTQQTVNRGDSTGEASSIRHRELTYY